MDSNLLSGAINVATAAARNAGSFIAQSINQLDRVKVSVKSTSQSREELVSEIDVLAEQRIIEELKESYPQHNFVSEEAGNAGIESDYCWIIDPLDGTHNFLHGHPHCCISIALKFKDEVVAAVVYDPLRNELFSAKRGGGAQLDGRRIRVSGVSRLKDSLLCTGFPYRSGSNLKRWMKSFAGLMPRAQSIHRTGSSVLDFAYVAAGRYDGFWEFGLQEWDIAAGALLVREAGGLVTDVDGGADISSTKDVIAGAPKVHEKILHLIKHV